MNFIAGILGARKVEVPCEVTKGDPQEPLTLISFPAGSGSCSSLTPFGTKVETILRMADLPYDAMIGDIRNPKHAPKHKFPVLHHGSNLVSDSSFITEYLANTFPEQMAPLLVTDPQRKAVAHSVKRMLEESLYFHLMYQQWQVDEYWEQHWPKIFPQLPAAARFFVPGLVRSGVLRDLSGQGIGRLHFEDVQRRAWQDLEAVAVTLGDSPYLTGTTPCEVDCTLFALIDQILVVAGEHTPLGKAVLQHPNLVDFHKRIKAKYYDGKPSKLYPPSK